MDEMQKGSADTKKMMRSKAVFASGFLALLASGCATAPANMASTAATGMSAPPPAWAVTSAAPAARPALDRAAVERMIADWPNRPQLAATRMIEKYGAPQEATEARLVWHDKGPWKRIMVVREETPHYFPRLHMDYIYQTINFHVPPEKADEVIALDGSILIDRTKGEVTSRCDREEANIITHNMMHNIVTGRMTVEQAKRAFAMAEKELLMGRKLPVAAALQFTPPQAPPLDPGRVEIPGSPLLAADADPQSLTPTSGMGDAEVAAFNAVINLNEIDAATDAKTKATSPQVRQFAQMIHIDHGGNLSELMMMGARMNMPAAWTPAADHLRREGAGKLARVIRLDGPAFDRAWIDLMIEDHAKALQTIDALLLPAARNPQLRQHLAATRSAVASHLQEARRIRATLGS